MPPRWNFVLYCIAVLQIGHAYGVEQCALEQDACKVQAAARALPIFDASKRIFRVVAQPLGQARQREREQGLNFGAIQRDIGRPGRTGVFAQGTALHPGG